MIKVYAASSMLLAAAISLLRDRPRGIDVQGHINLYLLDRGGTIQVQHRDNTGTTQVQSRYNTGTIQVQHR